MIGILSELKQMAAEMDTFRYVPRQWHSLDAIDGEDFCHGRRGMWGNAAGGHAMITASVAGAEVYHDIIAEGAKGTRDKIHAAIDQMILGIAPKNKSQENTQRAIYRVALGRIGAADDVAVSPAALPAGAGDYYTPCHRLEFYGVHRAPESRAAVLGGKLAQCMRRHAKAPYGARGQAWMVNVAREVFRLANQEL